MPILKFSTPCLDFNWDTPSIPAYFAYGIADRENHYLNREWPHRETNVIGKFNVCNEPLIDIRHTILPPLHVKLGIVKQFVSCI